VPHRPISSKPVVEAGPDPTTPYWENNQMWEKLTPDDIARAKHKLSLTRAATLSRHAVELKVFDGQQDEIDKFEHLVGAFTEKYLKADTDKPALQPTRLDGQTIEVREIEAELILPSNAGTAEETGEPAASDVPREKPSLGLHVQQHVSPNFGIPLRRFAGR
jgi:hypothetical protein